MKNTLLRHCMDVGAIRKGKFQLKSGRTSDIYCDMRLAALDPNCLAIAVEALNGIIINYGFDSVGVMEGAGSCVLLGALLQYIGDVSGFVIRKEPKGHGTCKMVEGAIGAKPILIDDVATSGGSLVHAITNMAVKPLIAAVLVDRQEGAAEAIKPFGVDLISVFTLTEIRECQL